MRALSNRLGAWNPLGAALLCVSVAAAGLRAQQPVSISQGDEVRRAWAPVVARANPSVVEVFADGSLRALGTVVARDLVVSKASELRDADGKPAAVKVGRIADDGGAGERFDCVRVGIDRPADLVLLRVPGVELQPIVWQDDVPEVGAFLATPDGTELPIGVGILSCAPYRHTPDRAFLGVRFADASGDATLEEAVEHGAAHAAGLRGGDLVLEFAGVAIDGSQALREQIQKCRPGDDVKVRVRRGDEELEFEVVLGTNNQPRPSNQERIWGELSEVRSGFATVLQHDTVLEPADCGGPVLDLGGRAVGVNIARAGRVESLALPAADVRRIVDALLVAER